MTDTATIQNGVHCKLCGWPIVFACCNNEMAILHPYDDYWSYCTNQGCKHHVGEPVTQAQAPSFYAYDNN